MASSLQQRLFISNESDKVASNEEQEVTTNKAQDLYAFVADDKSEEEQCNNITVDLELCKKR